MTITAYVVLYAVTWFMCLFVVLPLRLTTQHDIDQVTPGTPPSAPSNLQMTRKLGITTIVATIIFAVILAVILSELISVRDLDFFNRM